VGKNGDSWRTGPRKKEENGLQKRKRVGTGKTTGTGKWQQIECRQKDRREAGGQRFS